MWQLQSFMVFGMWQQLSFGNNALFFLIIIGLYSVLHNCKVYSCFTNYFSNIASFYLIFSTLCDLCMLPVIESVDEMRFNYIPIYPSGFITAAAVFWKPNAIPLCVSTDLVQLYT